MPTRRVSVWQSHSLKAIRRRRLVLASLVVLNAALFLRILFPLASLYGWGSILDWAVVAIPTIAGLAAWVIPVKETTVRHKWILFVGGLAFSGLILFQQHLTRQAHALELSRLATKEDIKALPSQIAREILKITPTKTKEVKEVAGVQSPPKVAQSPTPNQKPDNVAKGIEELKELIKGQSWGLTADQLTLLSRRMAPYATSRDRADLITSILGDSDSAKFAISLVAAFRASGWKLSGSGFSQAMYSGNPVGIIIQLHSRDSSPRALSEFVTTLREAHIEPVGEIDDKVPAGDFRIIVGRKP